MYRIRTSLGEESVFKTLEEFNAAVRSGIITADDEIFHSRADKWLDVKTHPHYRNALGLNGNGDGHSPKPAISQLRIPQGVGNGVKPGLTKSGTRPALTTIPPKPTNGQSAPVQRPAAPSGPQLSIGSSGVRPAQPAAKPASNPLGNSMKPVGSASAPVPVVPQAPKAPVAQPVPPKPQPVESKPVVAAKPVASAPAPAPAPPAPAAAAKPMFPPAVVPKPVDPDIGEIMFVDVEEPKKAVEKPIISAAPYDEFLVLDSGVEAPQRISSGHPVIEQGAEKLLDIVHSPAPPAPPTPFEPPKLAPQAHAPAVAIPPAPVRLVPPVVEALAHEPEAPPTPIHRPRAEKGKAGLIAAALGAVALLGVVAFVWKPWAPANQGSTAESPAVTGAIPTPTPTPQVVAQAATGIGTQPPTTQPGPIATQPAPLVQKPTPTETPAPIKVDSAPQEAIVAAVKPDFSTGGDLPDTKVDVPTTEVTGAVGVAPSELLRRYNAAAASARQDLYARLMAAGFIRIFSASRLSTIDGLSSAEGAWNQGGEGIRQYRAKIAKIEKVYDDSVLASQRSGRWPAAELRVWAGRTSFTEPTESAQVSDLMLKQVSELLALLDSQQGKFEVKGGAFSFKDPSAGQQYNTKRIWVAQRMEQWGSTPEAARPLTVTQILKALGDGLPAGQ